jgi:hypothetical protein
METARGSHVHEATLDLAGGVDPGAVGAAVTTELCGHWEHEGPCRWPHNNAIETDAGPARFRTLFVAPDAEVHEVHERIDLALRSSQGWTLVASGRRAVAVDELDLAARLAR